MEKDKMVLCRPFYCPECEKLNRPVEEYMFAVFRGTHQDIFFMKATWRGTNGITPHLIFYDGVHTKEYVEILVACGIVGCGVSMGEIVTNENGEDEALWEVRKVRKYRINHFDWESLKTYRDPQYLLNKHRFNQK
jgi:hypothetical protein